MNKIPNVIIQGSTEFHGSLQGQKEAATQASCALMQALLKGRRQDLEELKSTIKSLSGRQHGSF